MKTISQREARRLRKRVEELERHAALRANAWATDWPGGVHIDRIHVNDIEVNIARTARKLGHALVIVPSHSDNHIDVYAVKP